MSTEPPFHSSAPDAVAVRRGAQVWHVGELLRAIGQQLAARFPACTVEGELSGYSRAASGHCYFSLKDAEGQGALLRCALFRRAAVLLDFAPADGQRVQARGRLAVYEPRGELQFVVESLRPAGTGSLHELFLRLKARLEAEGLFDAARKRALPPFPRRIGIVTSLGAAALHDMATALARRAPHVAVVVYPAPVQGAEAPARLAEAIALAGARAEVDLLLVCRGGGSAEDLWAFNDERVVRAIAASPLPVVSGVGHETDVTLADFAADVRAPTPTAAAELAAPATAACAASLDALAGLLRDRVGRLLDARRQRLDEAALRLTRPAAGVRRHAHALALLEHRLASAVRLGLRRPAERSERLRQRWLAAGTALRVAERHRLERLAARLDLLDPARTLARGWAWLADGQGRPLVAVADASVGQRIAARLADGRIEATVTAVEPADGAGA